jgi:hypothetical protein
VPQNDGVIGSVNSSRIADSPAVVDFMLGASQVLSGRVLCVECCQFGSLCHFLQKLLGLDATQERGSCAAGDVAEACWFVAGGAGGCGWQLSTAAAAKL